MEKIYRLEELSCAHCAAKMERKIAKIKGVISVNINFMTKKLIIEANEQDFNFILQESERIIKKIEKQVIIKGKNLNET